MGFTEDDRGAAEARPDRGQPAAAKARRDRSERNPERPPPSDTRKHPKPSLRERVGNRLAALRRHPLMTALIVIAIVAVVIGVVIWWLHARQFESTDDAFIDARTVVVSPEVAGEIVDVPVTDNQAVAAGAVLARIDPRDYQAARDEARAQLEQAHASVANFDAQIGAQQANIEQAHRQVTQAQAALKYSQQQNERSETLVKQGAGTVQAAQQATSDLTQKQAAFSGAQASAIAAERQLDVLQAQRKSALAQVDAASAKLEQAETNLSRTTITASVGGHVANLKAARGAYAQPGQAVMAVVPRQIWVTANFKETALAEMRVGQPVTIAIDAYPGKTFHGHVDSIQTGSGVAFSLLPPENATGNYVKVVQRVPVKIVFDNPPGVVLGPGMSVVPTVKVR
jgi:membrane fusion protein (multidrug efflux system)